MRRASLADRPEPLAKLVAPRADARSIFWQRHSLQPVMNAAPSVDCNCKFLLIALAPELQAGI